MKVILNGEPTLLADDATVATVVAGLDVPEGRGVAVAVDAEVIPRGEWAAHKLTGGAKVEVLRAIQGG